jgi:hypothetical protein
MRAKTKYIFCLIPEMNAKHKLQNKTPVITLWMITSLTVVFQVYIWNDLEKQRQYSLMATTSGSRMFKT